LSLIFISVIVKSSLRTVRFGNAYLTYRSSNATNLLLVFQTKVLVPLLIFRLIPGPQNLRSHYKIPKLKLSAGAGCADVCHDSHTSFFLFRGV
jgi:hypothetical protein